MLGGAINFVQVSPGAVGTVVLLIMTSSWLSNVDEAWKCDASEHTESTSLHMHACQKGESKRKEYTDREWRIVSPSLILYYPGGGGA